MALAVPFVLAGCSSSTQGLLDAAPNGDDEEFSQVETPAEESLPSGASDVQSEAGVPLITFNNGVRMPQLGYGTQIQALESDTSDSGRELLNETSRQLVASALRAGYRHLDTAHAYYNERGVGQGIIDSGVPRESIFLTSKLEPGEYGEGTSSAAIEAMLDRLQVDYIDLVYLHHPAGDYMGAWRDLEAAYREGKVRALGISNFDNEPDAFNAIVSDAEVKPQIMQIERHPFAQRQDTLELASRYSMQVEAWYPLGHADPDLLGDASLNRIASAHGKTVPQIILRWHMQAGHAAIPGSTSADHIEENVEIFDFELTDDEMAQIEAIDKGEQGRYFNIDYTLMGGYFMDLDD